tara:strand:- start:2479 stop:3027 length:549 start_codon:yes stop_codon:yes gene_type:complete
MITKENYVTASFTDNARKNIEILLKGEKENEVISHTIQLDETHPDYKDLLSIVDLETIHQNTRDKIKETQKFYKKQLKAIAKEDGLIFDVEDLRRKKVNRSLKTNLIFVFKFFIDYIFSDSFDTEKDKDLLFTLKLESFELDMAKNCGDRKLQMQLRKAKHPIEVIDVLLKMKNYENQRTKT